MVISCVDFMGFTVTTRNDDLMGMKNPPID
jgi:hypothetical protein